ncbi:sirohydrochlorin chelatase [Aeromicrobium sp.]|uniref:sirohydrochlorin chelatase n=1 Tax=Aeromicrobium sp. TaxID=1871063 RepID=UPI003C3C4C2A
MTTRRSGETLLVCSSPSPDSAEHAALGILVNAVRRDAPSVEVHDVPADMLRADQGRNGPEPGRPPVRVAVPLTLTTGTDVTDALAIALRLDPTLRVAAPLGPDWVLAEICVQRLVEAGARKDDTIVLGVDGSHHAAAIDGISRAARLLSAVWGGPVHIGSVRGPDVPLTEAVDIARAYGHRVVVASYVLTPGRLADTIRHCGADLVTAPLLDGGVPDQRLVTLVLSRFHQALDVGVRSVTSLRA